MTNVVIIAILVILIGFACRYIWKEKKKGNKCIGCSCGGCAKCKENQ